MKQLFVERGSFFFCFSAFFFPLFFFQFFFYFISPFYYFLLPCLPTASPLHRRIENIDDVGETESKIGCAIFFLLRLKQTNKQKTSPCSFFFQKSTIFFSLNTKSFFFRICLFFPLSFLAAFAWLELRRERERESMCKRSREKERKRRKEKKKKRVFTRSLFLIFFFFNLDSKCRSQRKNVSLSRPDSIIAPQSFSISTKRKEQLK